jgi:hypothetical protein
MMVDEICQKMKKNDNDNDNYMTNQTLNHEKDMNFLFIYQINFKSLFKETK